jgi:phosphoribosyl 1,2-cyclic phosphodiesterase
MLMNSLSPGEAEEFTVRFWGTRGTRMMAGEQFRKYGGNTICLEVRCGNRLIILDAGSGIDDLGKQLSTNCSAGEFDLFLTHAHYDHVLGIPFFAPLYNPGCRLNIWAGKLTGATDTRNVIDRLMIEPFFPVSIETFRADIRYRDIRDNEVIDLGDGITVHTIPLDHPGRATGYRIEFGGRSFALITDTSHTPGKLNQALAEFLRDVDAFAYDCSYVDAEFDQYPGFGHSTWEEAVRLRKASGARMALGLHHMPFKNDAAVDEIVSRISLLDDATSAATEGMLLRL